MSNSKWAIRVAAFSTVFLPSLALACACGCAIFDVGTSTLLPAGPGGTIFAEWVEAVEQLVRYLERIRLDPARIDCRGVLAAQRFKPQALTLAESRGIRCVEVDLAVLRGEREPELTLFS